MDLIIPKNKNLIVAGSPNLGGNSYYFFKMIRIKKIQPFKVIFLSRKRSEVAEIVQEEGTGSAYRLMSLKGIWYFLRAKTAVLTHGPADFFYFVGKRNLRKRVVNLWHSIVVKDMSGIGRGENLAWDIQVVSSLWEKSLYEGYGVKSKFAITGYPRNEYLVWAHNNEIEIKRVKNKLRQYSKIQPKTIILYAPTYRQHVATDFFPFEDYDSKQLIEFCQEHQILILIRLHPNEKKSSYENKLHKLLESNYVIFANRDRFAKMAELLLISNIVITDYSGSFFDFLLLDRPTIFLPYDRDDYDSRYGFAVDFDEISELTSCYSQSELLETIKFVRDGSAELTNFISEQKAKYHQYDPENCSSNLVNIFEN